MPCVYRSGFVRGLRVVLLGVVATLVSCATPQEPPPARQQAALPVEKTWRAGDDVEPRLVETDTV